MKKRENIAKIYPNGIHMAIKEMLGRNTEFNVRTATLEMPEHGLTDDVLNSTDVLIWWGHRAHAKAILGRTFFGTILREGEATPLPPQMRQAISMCQ